MQIVTVIPISGNLYSETLTYFYLNKIPAGTLVYVDIRGKSTPALVLKTQDASVMKAIIRGSDFSLKRLKDNTGINLLHPSAIKAVEFTARYHILGIASLLKSIIPKRLLELSNDVPKISNIPIEGSTAVSL